MVDKWLNKLWYRHQIECNTAIKSIYEELTVIWVNVYIFMLGEMSEYKLKYIV